MTIEFEIAAVVPVREGSRRLSGKNLSAFGGTSLLAHKVRQLKRVPRISAIYVSSDSPEMLKVAVAEGAIPLERPREYADDILGKSMSETIGFVADQIAEENLIWAQCTSPLVDEKVFDELLDSYASMVISGDHDSLITVQRLFTFIRTKDGPLNYEAGAGHVPSQNLPPLWQLTYGAQIAPTQDMVDWGYYYGGNPYLFEVTKRQSVDIDDATDLAIARALIDEET